jgi:hypothetical protein
MIYDNKTQVEEVKLHVLNQTRNALSHARSHARQGLWVKSTRRSIQRSPYQQGRERTIAERPGQTSLLNHDSHLCGNWHYHHAICLFDQHECLKQEKEANARRRNH